MDGEGNTPDPDDPIPDQGSKRAGNIKEDEIKDHHRDRWQHQAMYVGLHLPSRGKKRRHHHHKHHHHHRDKSDKTSSNKTESEPVLPPTPPSERVQSILGKTDDNAIESHHLFCELDELRAVGDDGDVEWKEMARWVKFEEDVEEGGERWSKPHVATLSLHSLFELRKGILKGTVMLDTEANNLAEIIALVLDNMIASGQLGENERERTTETLLSRHHHQHDKKESMPRIRSLADIGKKSSSKALIKDGSNNHITSKNSFSSKKRGSVDILDAVTSHLPGKHHSHKHAMNGDANRGSGTDLHESGSTHKYNQHFLKKLPQGAEASNILVGEAEFLSQPIIAFVRLGHSIVLGELTEVPVPTRFIFIMLGPQGQQQQYHEIGRSIATLMSDEVFHQVAYKAKGREDLLAGIDEFLDQVTVLPPGEWDPSIRIEPPKSVPSQAGRTGGAPGGPPGGGTANGGPVQEEPEEEVHGDPTLVRTGRLFGGLINDIKRKVPFYPSDIKDVLHLQCISSFFFVYFACLSPIVTFGGLLEKATNKNMAAFESLLSGAICGISYHIFAGQPLTIIGSTGPVLVFETIVYDFASDQGFNYLTFRFWIGIWTSLILFFMVMFDLSALVRYITRFTEESFALLIALIYIYEAFKKLYLIQDYHSPATYDEIRMFNDTCICSGVNITEDYFVTNNVTREDWYDTCKYLHGELEGPGCHPPSPDVYYFSWLLFIFTFIIAYYGKAFKDTPFLKAAIRNTLSDFAVTIAIVAMVVTDYLVGLKTPKLFVPDKFAPTSDERGWVVDPSDNPVWTIFAAIGFALLATILIFMDQQITAVIVNRKEHKLKKGSGYHLDLLVIAIQIAVCSVLGLPWFVAATVLSINHVHSLTVLSETAAPGERPKFLGIREQRVTGITVFLFVGLSVLFTPVLKLIPMPVLYGVFLYMGVSSVKGIELCQRIACFFMPAKYQPDYIYLRHVPLRRVYFYTSIQVVCLVVLWVIKSFKSISIAFPIMVLAMCFVRKALDWVFTRHELKWLDDIMPESHKREKEKKKKEAEKEEGAYDNKALLLGETDGKTGGEHEDIHIPCGAVSIPLQDGKSISIAVDHITYKPHTNQVNISEEMAKTAVWKQLVANESNPNLFKENGVRQRKPKTSEADNQDNSVKFNIGPPEDESDPTEVVVDQEKGYITTTGNSDICNISKV